MPIRFRCGHCNRLLGIARRKAGTDTTCPHCGYALTVPAPPTADRTELVDFEALLNPESSEVAPEPEPRSQKTEESFPRPRATPPPLPPPGERPLFEQDLDAIFGELKPELNQPDDPKRKPLPTSGMDALSLAPERGPLVLSPQKVTMLAIAVGVLVLLSFVAGYLVASLR